MLDTVLSKVAWARSSSCPSTLLKKLFMVADSELQQGQNGEQCELPRWPACTRMHMCSTSGRE